MSITEQIITDKKGKAIAVQLPVNQYKTFLFMLQLRNSSPEKRCLA